MKTTHPRRVTLTVEHETFAALATALRAMVEEDSGGGATDLSCLLMDTSATVAMLLEASAQLAAGPAPDARVVNGLHALAQRLAEHAPVALYRLGEVEEAVDGALEGAALDA